MKKYYLIIFLFLIVSFLNARSKNMGFEIENNPYRWNVSFVYYVDGKSYAVPGKLSFPQAVSVLFEGYNEFILLPIEEIAEFYYRIRFGLFKDKVCAVSRIKLKDGSVKKVKRIQLTFKNVAVPEKSFRVKDSESTTETISVSKTDIRSIRLKNPDKGGNFIRSSGSSGTSGTSRSSKLSRSSGAPVLPKQKWGMERVKYPKGTMIIKEDSYAEKIYFIIDGKVKVYKRIKGEKTEMGIMGPDDFFGEISLFLHEKSNVSVETIEDCEMLVGSKSDFINTMKYNPDKLVHFIEKMAKRLAASEEIIRKSKGQVKSFKATHLLPYTEE